MESEKCQKNNWEKKGRGEIAYIEMSEKQREKNTRGNKREKEKKIGASEEKGGVKKFVEKDPQEQVQWEKVETKRRGWERIDDDSWEMGTGW